MAASIGLDIGSRTIKLVQLEKAGKEVRLVKAGIHLLSHREREGEAARLEAVTKGLTQLFSELKLPPNRSINLAVSGQSVFIRSIQVIAITQEKLKQHIRFEAEQQIPFSLHEVLWDYCLVNPPGKKKLQTNQGRDSGQWKVVLVAIKKELVERQLELIEKIKGRCQLLDVGPMALYNGTSFLDQNLSKQPTLLLDIGARGTNLVIAANGEAWIRSFPLGADKLTQAVAEATHLGFNEAEALKQRVGLESSNEVVEQQALEAMKPVIADLVEEIQRSIEYYQGQFTGTSAKVPKLEKVFLSGGGALLKGIAASFQEKLGFPIEIWTSLSKIPAKTTIAESPVLFGTAVGLALRGLVELPIELNLLRERVLRQIQKRTVQFYGGGSLLLFFSLLGMIAQSGRQVYLQKADYLEELKKTIKVYQNYEPKIKELEIKNESLKNQLKSLYVVLRQRQRWLETFNDLEKLLPKEVWLTGYEGGLDITSSASESSAGALRLIGRSLSYQGVTEFVTQLKSSVRFTQVKPVSSNIKKLESGEEVVEFQVEMKLVWQ